MKLNIRLINKVLLYIAIFLVVGGGIWCLFLSPARQIIVGITIALGLVNLGGIYFFIGRNTGKGEENQSNRK